MTATISASTETFERARRVVAGLRYGRRNHVLGCPMGCKPGRHEIPLCLVDEPIEHDFERFEQSGLFVSRDGSARLISLREHRERVA